MTGLASVAAILESSQPPCSACPWVIGKSQIPASAKAAAKRGQSFTCHKSMGTCYGAELMGKLLRLHGTAAAEVVSDGDA